MYPWPSSMLFLRPMFYFFLMVNHQFIWYPIRIYTYPGILCSTQLKKCTHGMWVGINGDVSWRTSNSGSDITKGSTLLRVIDKFPKASKKENLLLNVSISNLASHWQTEKLFLRPTSRNCVWGCVDKRAVFWGPRAWNDTFSFCFGDEYGIQFVSLTFYKVKLLGTFSL